MDCSTCGNKCCKAWGAGILAVTLEDIQNWTDNDALPLKYLVDGKAWFDPTTKEKLDACPFLSTDGCSIYPKDGEADMRPAICGAYPFGQPCLNETMSKPVVIDDDHQINIAFYETKRRNIIC